MQRVHSLDAYRGVLMLLGIVIHSAFKFPVDEGDYVTEAVNHLSLWVVHIFRMPAFFILSGFFGSLLWRRYGGAGMLMNRFERVVLPLFAYDDVTCPHASVTGAIGTRCVIAGRVSCVGWTRGTEVAYNPFVNITENGCTLGIAL